MIGLKNLKLKLKTNNMTMVCIIALTTIVSSPAVSADSTGNITQIESFIKSVIESLAAISGLVATGFFVIGGFHYMTSSGHPEHLNRAKRTIVYSAVGLAITVGAFVLSSIVSNLATTAFGS